MLSQAKLKELSKLKTKKGRKHQRRFLIEGLRLCEELASSCWPIESVLFTSNFEQKSRGRKLLKKLKRSNVELIPAKAQMLRKLSDTVSAQGVICVARIGQPSLEDLKGELSVIVALDGIRDPGNAGTLIRTADAFGGDAVLLSNDTVELYNPKVIRSTMGSIFHLKIFDEIDLEKAILQLKKYGFKILGTTVKGGKVLEQLEVPGKICLLVGNETEGLKKKLLKLSDEIVQISTSGKAESLNVAVAGGILLYELARKRLQASTK